MTIHDRRLIRFWTLPHPCPSEHPRRVCCTILSRLRWGVAFDTPDRVLTVEAIGGTAELTAI